MKEKMARVENPEQKAAHAEKEEDDAIYNAIILACLVGIIVIVGLILTAREPEGFTELYLLNYTDRPVDGLLNITYGISNHEGRQVGYRLGFIIGNETVYERQMLLADNETDIRGITLPYSLNRTSKVMLELGFLNQTQEVHFWTR